MTKKDKQGRRRRNHVKADVIILGCSLPGIVTAHNLKKKFGNTMDIVVLDLAGSPSIANFLPTPSRGNVAFTESSILKPQHDDDEEDVKPVETSLRDIPQFYDSIARYYLAKYAKDFKIPLPDAIIDPQSIKSSLNKLFEYCNGSIIECKQNYHDFNYLNFVERFELEQYQTLVDSSMQQLFETTAGNTKTERKKLLHYDKTSMEEDICQRLFFPTSREIMRTIVRLVCGTTADNVSLLFYLHQCYRNHSSKNHVDGNNTRLREKLLGYSRKRLTFNLQQSIADITLSAKPIKEIRAYADEQVILEPTIGETDYICNLLAMALRPDQLRSIQLENSLVTQAETEVVTSMGIGAGKKFMVQYSDSFWRKAGYSGDILSVKGPVIWAMERPNLANTGTVRGMDTVSSIVGFLKVKHDEEDSREAVLDQLVKLFGQEAASPLQYKETNIKDIYIPRRGDFVALRKLTTEQAEQVPKLLEWGALDIFAEGDIAAAIEAGHTAYLHLLSSMRPQSLSYDDVAPGSWPTNLQTFSSMTASVNIMNSSRYVLYGVSIIVGLTLLKNFVFRSRSSS